MLAAVLIALTTAMFQPVNAATTAQPPQVFIRDPGVQADPGENGHVLGLRPPGDNDADGLPLFNARGDSIRAALGVWRTATGKVTFDRTPQSTKVRATFLGLIPTGHYSLFVRQLAGRAGVAFTPLDLVGAANNFSADDAGRGDIIVDSPLQLPTGAQLVLVYHSDRTDHQSSIGVLGTNAHPQLITRVP